METIRAYHLILLACLLVGCSSAAKEQTNRPEKHAGRKVAAKAGSVAAQGVSHTGASSQQELAADLSGAEQPADSGRNTRVEQSTETAEDSLQFLPDGFRYWTDQTGRRFPAQFVDVLDGNVCLQKPSGEGVVIPLDQLCEEDRRFVEAQLERMQKNSLASTTDDGEVAGSERAGTVSSHRIADAEVQPVAIAPPPPERDYHTTQKVVVPFDFESKFDNGRYGQMVGEMIWKKLERAGGFIIPESMLDVREVCRANGWELTPETPLEQVAKIVREGFQADIGIWGRVERAPGVEWDIYDLVIKCVDFSQDPPKVIYEVSTRTKTVSEIPHLYVKQMLQELYGREEIEEIPLPPIAEENWRKNPNLVVGGDFEQGANGVPLGWEDRAGQEREPLGRLVKWVPEEGNPSNKVIRFEFSAGVGNSTGVMYYSKFFPIEEGATYRFQCRYRTNGPAVKVFIKCYDEVAGPYKPASGSSTTTARNRYQPDETRLREVYRSQQNLKGPKNVWNVHTEEFTPKHTRYTPRWGRVMLYAYLGGGVVEFDDVVVKQILPPSPSASKKVLRHSMASDVTLEEMQENERRAAEARQRLQQQNNP